MLNLSNVNNDINRLPLLQIRDEGRTSPGDTKRIDKSHHHLQCFDDGEKGIATHEVIHSRIAAWNHRNFSGKPKRDVKFF